MLFLWFLLGAFAMRSAGCVYNDIVDRDLDLQVERTRLRPLASGRVSLRAAWALAIGLSLVGLVVLLQLPRVAQVVALISLVPVAAYPFMKRITWWPQAWLGLVFSWGALVGWPAVTGEFELPALLLWVGSIFWVIGYDTLYAIQDIEDDALVGVKSSARALGDRAQAGRRHLLCAGAHRLGGGDLERPARLAGAYRFASRCGPPRPAGRKGRSQRWRWGAGAVPLQPLYRFAFVSRLPCGRLVVARLTA